MPFAWIVIVILWWCVSAIMKSKKDAEAKAAKQTIQRAPQKKPAADSQSAPAPKPAAMSRADEWEDEEDSWDDRDAMRGQRQPVAPTVTARPVQASAASHASKPFEAHMHTPVMGVQGVGTEGIDCCHDFMLGGIEASEPAEFLPMQEEEPSDRAKALLQGVIYSEILGRRPMKRYQSKHTQEKELA